MVFVPPPDRDARRFRIWQLANAHRRDLDLIEPLLAITEAGSGSDLDALFEDDELSWDDPPALAAEAARHCPGVLDWLASARSMAVFARSGVMVDDLSSYLQRFRLF